MNETPPSFTTPKTKTKAPKYDFQRFVLQHQDAMNETELAQKLGISRKCLWERRQRFGIPRQKQKSA